MAQYTKVVEFNASGTRTNQYRLELEVNTRAVSGGTELSIEAYVRRFRFDSVPAFSSVGSRSYNVPGGRVNSPTGTVFPSGSASWSYDFRNSSREYVWAFKRYFSSSYGSTASVSLTASGSGSSFLTTATATISNIALFSNVTVPNVIGQTQSTAVSNIQNAGLSASVQSTTSGATSSNNGKVKSQSPSGGSSVSSGSTVTITVYNYVPPTYTVSFNSSGGSSNPPSESVLEGNKIDLPSPGTRTNYTFRGWLADGAFRPVGYDYFPTSNITLTAYWTALTWDITYFEQGGTNVSNDSVTRGSSVTLPTTTREGFNFLGWYTASSGGTRVGSAGQSYTPFNNVSLYAQWTESTPGFTDQSVTSALLINQDISTTANSSVSATNATSYAIEYVPSELNPTGWLSIDNNGNLSGSTSDVGAYSFRVVATGPGGTTNSINQTIIVSYPGKQFIQGDAFAPISSIRRFDGINWNPVSFVRRWNGTSWEDASN